MDEPDRLSEQAFVFSLAWGLAIVALSLGATFLLTHVVAIAFELGRLRRLVSRTNTLAEFAGQFGAIHSRLSKSALIGHAWKEFHETLVLPDEDGGVVRNTIRPQSFINFEVAREQLFGLKIMSSIPGYFVGVGLLLTFIGLVLALQKAATAVNVSGAGDMQDATRELLQVATFKFATSIAGLGASIVLSFVFRTYTIWMEASFDRFCRAVEERILYTPPQSITLAISRSLDGQLNELKQINSADFFARMGETISPQIEKAFLPVQGTIAQAMDRLTQDSRSGVSELVDRFTQGIQSGAGTELTAVVAALRETQTALVKTQNGMHGTGEDFGRRLSDAAENLNRLISNAGEKLSEGSDRSRAVLAEAAEALREGFSQALATTANQISKVQASAIETVANVATRSAEVLDGGLADALSRIKSEVDRLEGALRSSQAALEHQAKAVHEAADQSRSAADAFGRTAQDVRTASGPLVQAGDKIALSTEKMAGSVAAAAKALEEGQASSKVLANALVTQIERMSTLWSQYVAQFEKVDADLGKAVAHLAEATIKQGQMLSDYAAKVDEGFASAITKLNPFLQELKDNTDDLGVAVVELNQALVSNGARGTSQ